MPETPSSWMLQPGGHRLIERILYDIHIFHQHHISLFLIQSRKENMTMYSYLKVTVFGGLK